MMLFWTIAVTLAVGILSGLGVGSAGLLVVFLSVVAHLPQLEAQGLNLIFFLFSSGAALAVHAFRTELLISVILFLIPAGVTGAVLGSLLAMHIKAHLLRRLFGILLIFSGAFGLFRKNC